MLEVTYIKEQKQCMFMSEGGLFQNSNVGLRGLRKEPVIEYVTQTFHAYATPSGKDVVSGIDVGASAQVALIHIFSSADGYLV